MPRSPRYLSPGAVHHVMLRGNQGRPIFYTDADRCRCCLLLQEGVQRFGHRIHAFCLMGNHIHLAVQEGDVGLSKAFQNLAFRHAQRINKTRDEVGHVFQGRFKTVRVDSRRYLLNLVRYIHLNPVRAGIVSKPEDYKWSGHNAYLGKDAYVWLERDYVLSRLSGERTEAIRSYDAFICAGIGVEPEFNFEIGVQAGILGDDDFVEEILEGIDSFQVEKEVVPTSKFIDEICRKYQISLSELSSSTKVKNLSHVRAILAFLVRESPNHTLVELGGIINRDTTGLSRLANRFALRCDKNESLKQEIRALRESCFTAREGAGYRVAAALPHGSDFVVVVKGEKIAVQKEELLLCEALKARVRLEESSSMWSNTVKMEEELPEMPIELPEGMELETFKQMLQCLPTGRIAEGVPNLEALLDCADYFGAIPIIEEGQLVLLRELDENVDRLRPTDLKDALGKILSKSSSSRQVQNVASKVFKNVIFSAAKNKAWERVGSLLEFAKSYSAFDMCLHSMEFDLSGTELLPIHVKLAFDFNLVEFQQRIKEVFASKVKTESKISLILEQYQVSADAKFVLQGIVRQYIREDVFRDVWEYAEKTEDLDLKKICLDYVEGHPREVVSLWGPFEIPEQIAKCLAGPTLLL